MKVKLLSTDALRVAEAAERLGVTTTQVYHLVLFGELRGGPATDGWVRVPEDAIDEYLERQRTV
jgi:excisionase family DNA binding protein